MAGSNIEKLIESYYGDQLQKIENMLYSLYDLTSIDNSEGEQLDKIGKMINQPRMALTDTDYRNFLKGKIAQSMSHGTTQDLYITYETMTGETTIELHEYFPRYCEMHASDTIGANYKAYIQDIMQKACVAGVKFGGVRNIAGAGFFRFDGEDFFEGDLSTTTGWTVGTNWSIDTVNETADHAAGATGFLSFPGTTHTLNNYYTAKVTCSVSGGNLRYYYGDGIAFTNIPAGTNGKFIIKYQATGGQGIVLWSEAAAVVQITEIKVFEQGSDGYSSIANPTIGGKWNYYITK